MAFRKEALERGIEQCKKNIRIFEEAIEKERQTIIDYYDMIEQNQKQELLEKEKMSHIEIVRESSIE
jgi:hypothetical protein